MLGSILFYDIKKLYSSTEGLLGKVCFFVLHFFIWSFFLEGGCKVQEVRMEILLNGSTIISRSGNCQMKMVRMRVNMAPYIGQIVVVKLVDSAVGSWGHILFDDLRHEVPCGGMCCVLPWELMVTKATTMTKVTRKS